MQLRCKNKKLHNLIISKPKILDSFKIPVINLSTENLDTEPLRYGLHHSYIEKNKNLKKKCRYQIRVTINNFRQMH